MGLEPYEYDQDPEYRPQDDGSRYPYEDFYGTGGRPPRKSGGGHGGLWILLILLLAVGGVAALLGRYSLDVRQTKDGITVSLQDSSGQDADQTQEAVEDADTTGDAAILQPSAGGEAQLTIADTPDEMPPTQAGTGQGLSFQEIYQKVIPSVVSITTTVRNGTTTGTGIVMSQDGYIITNDHVIDDAVAVEVLTYDDVTYTASLVGSDETSDLAVLKVDADDLVAAEFGDSENMVVGDTVVAIGDPLGIQLRGTMTDGIVSAINRDLVVNGRNMTLIQTTAALNNGNSGGPLINVFGQVIGINTMKMSSYYTASSTIEGLGFAIPISTAKPIIDELIEKGYVSGRPAIGINGRTLPDAALAYYRLPEGIYVESVDPSSDAYEKGIREGDMITAIEGTAVETQEDLDAVKNQFKAGDTINLTVFRDGDFYSVDVVLMDAAG